MYLKELKGYNNIGKSSEGYLAYLWKHAERSLSTTPNTQSFLRQERHKQTSNLTIAQQQ